MIEHYGDDNTGYARFYGTSLWGGEEESMILARPSLKGATNPVLRMNVASTFSVGNKLLIEVRDGLYGPTHVVKTIVFDDPALENWTPIEVSLAEFVDQDYIHLSFHGIPVAEDCNIFIDEIEVRDVLEHDASIKAFSVSDNLVEVGKTTANVNVTIENRGSQNLVQGDYIVKIYAGERVIGTFDGQALQPYETWNISCEYAPQSSDPSPVAVYAEVVYPADQDLSNNKSAAVEWTEYTIELPEGAKFFAIRCISHDRCALMIDDVTYESAAHPLEVTLVGYNVYCNGQLITPEPITELFYIVPGIDPNASYYVTAVYDSGESEPSNSVSISDSGIEELSMDDLQNAPIYDLQGRRVLNPERGQIYVTKGKKFLYR